MDGGHAGAVQCRRDARPEQGRDPDHEHGRALEQRVLAIEAHRRHELGRPEGDDEELHAVGEERALAQRQSEPARGAARRTPRHGQARVKEGGSRDQREDAADTRVVLVEEQLLHVDADPARERLRRDGVDRDERRDRRDAECDEARRREERLEAAAVIAGREADAKEELPRGEREAAIDDGPGARDEIERDLRERPRAERQREHEPGETTRHRPERRPGREHQQRVQDEHVGE